MESAKKSLVPGVVCAVFLFTMASFAQVENYATAWSGHQAITINTSTITIPAGAVVKNFPVLVRLNPSNFPGGLAGFLTTKTGGADIRFSKADWTAHIPYQIERWVTGTGGNDTAEIWVLVDSIVGNTPVKNIVMHYGNAAAVDSSKSTAVFDTANGFQAVWHMNEAAGANILDATSNAFTGLPKFGTGMANPADTVGAIGRAKVFTGNNTAAGNGGTAGNYYIVANSGTGKLNFLEDTSNTVSAWVLVDTVYTTGTTVNNDRYIVGKGGSQYVLQHGYNSTLGPRAQNFGFVNYDRTYYSMQTGVHSTTGGWVASMSPVTVHQWRYVVGVRNLVRQALFVNGVCTDTTDTCFAQGSTAARRIQDSIAIGAKFQAGALSNWFDGKADEVTISKGARDSNWIKLCYHTQRPDSIAKVVQIVCATAPAAPSLVTPANAATGIAINTTLTWNPCAGATTYRVQVSTESLFAAPVINDSTVTTSYRAVVLTSLPTTGTTYYWRVNAKNASGTSAYSNAPAVWSFTTQTPPTVPTLTTPANNATCIAVGPTLTWSATGAVTYRLQVSTVSTFASTVYDNATLTTASSAVGTLASGTVYYWRVNATNTGGTTAWATANNFTTLPPVPGVPTPLLAPANLSTGQPLTTTLTWTAPATGGAVTTYHVEVSTDSTFATVTLVNDSTTAVPPTVSYAVTGMANSTKYYWRVQGKNCGGVSAWTTPTWNFTTITTPPGSPALTSPANLAGGVSITPALTWTAPGGTVTNYHYQVSTASDFSAITAQDSTLTGVTVTLGTALTGGSTYYWHVRAKNSAGWGPWAAAWSFTTQTPPAAPTLNTPANNATCIAVGTTLSWLPVTGATGYRLQVSTVSTFATITFKDSTLGAVTSAALSGFANNTVYYWRVNASNGGGASGWSGANNFTTLPVAPVAPIAPFTPANNATGQPLTTTLTWTAPATGGAVVTYHVQVSAFPDSNFAAPFFVDSAIAAPTVSRAVTGLANSTKYYWRVRSKNCGGVSAWTTPTWNFTTITAPPGSPALTSPANLAGGVSITPALTWTAPGGTVTNYHYQVSTASDFSAITVQDSTLTGVTVTLGTALTGGSTYYWHVRAKNSAGWGPWAAAWSFTTQTPPAQPVLSTPGNNATCIAVVPNATLSWSSVPGATGYRLQVSTVSTFASTVKDSNIVGGTIASAALSGLIGNTTYYWRVNASNGGGASAWASAYSFLTVPPVPGVPAAPFTPATASVNVAVNATLTWTAPATGGAVTTYHVQVSTDSMFVTPAAFLVNDSTATVPPTVSYAMTGMANSTKYYWRVRSKNCGGVSAWPATMNFTTVIAAPTAAPTLTAPTSGLAGRPVTDTVKWTAVAGAATYHVEVSTDSTFAGAMLVNDSTTVTALLRAVTGMANGTKYYWRVQAKNAVGVGPWAAAWNFTTIVAAPTLSSPANAATSVALTTALTWQGVTGAATYYYQVSTSTAFGAGTIQDSTLTGLTVSPAGLGNNTTYYWRARAKSGGYSGAWSAPFSFTTIVALPGQPTLTFPANNAANQALSPAFNWTAGGGGAVATYRLQVAKDSLFTTLVVDSSGIPGASCTINKALDTNTVYYWQVNGTNAAGTGAWAAKRSFTTKPAAPDVPVLVSPDTNATNVVITPNLALSWNAAARAATYRLQVSTASTFATNVVDQANIATTSVTSTALTNNTTYYWRVRAINTAGDSSAYSVATRKFTTIIGAPATPTLTNPAFNALNIALNPIVSWGAVANATSYYLQVATDSLCTIIAYQDSLQTTNTDTVTATLTAATKYWWRVRAKNIGGVSAWVVSRPFTTQPALPAAPVAPIAPTDGLTGVSVTPTLSWTAGAGGGAVAKYWVQISNTSDFSTLVYSDSSSALTTRAVTGLASTSTYYWRVRAQNFTGASAWSSVWSFSTITGRPATFTVVSPANGATGVAVNPMLMWQTANMAAKYIVQVSTVSTFAPLFTTDSTTAALDTSRALRTALTTGVLYYWRVIASNGSGTRTSTDSTWSFTTGAGPAMPTLASPANNATGVAVSPTMVWHKPAGTPTGYRLQVSANSSFTSTVFDDSTITDTTSTGRTISLGGSATYYWRVNAKNGSGTSAWSAVWAFTTTQALPPPPPLVSPANNAVNIDTSTLNFVWNTAAGATSYSLNIDTTTSFSSGAAQTYSDLPDTSFALTTLHNSTRYFWRVNSKNGAGTSAAWSVTDTFTTKFVVPQPPALTYPLNGATSVAAAPTVTWDPSAGAATYRVQVSTDPLFATTAVDDSALTGLSDGPLGAVVAGMTYYWRAKAKNSAGPSVSWSPVFSFSTVQENYSAWQHSSRLYINTSSTGANVKTGVANFPLLVRLNPGNFGSFGQTQPGGTDVRFAPQSDTSKPLPYEIERWVNGAANNDTADIWVRVPSVNANDSTQYIVMFWGNGSAGPSRSNPYAVFDTATGYANTWHMNEPPTAAGAVRDRTLNVRNATPAGSMTSANSVAGDIGNAISFNGTGNYLSLDTIRTVFTKGITVSGWVKSTALANSAHLVDLGANGAGDNNIILGYAGSGTDMNWNLWNGGTSTSLPTTSGAFLTNVWTHVAAVMDSGSNQMAVYQNGVLSASKTLTGPALASNVTRLANLIAKSNNGADALFSGIIDELEVSKIRRDSSWIKLAYETQKTGAAALCYPPSITLGPHDTTVTLGLVASFTAAALGNNLHYQWQRSDNNGVSWNPATGIITNPQYQCTTRVTDTVGAGPQFRCKVSNIAGSATSSAATLTVCVPTLVTQPSGPVTVTAFVGDTAYIAGAGLQCQGRGLTYGWQRNKNGGGWNTAPGVSTTALYNYPTDSSDTNVQFRCQVNGMACSAPATSPVITLSLCYKIVIVTQPASKTATAGQPDSLWTKVSAGKTTLSYQWQRKGASQTGFLPDPRGTNSPVLHFSPADTADNLARFRCQITNACGLAYTDSTVTLGVCAPAQITLQPVDTNATVGAPAHFHVIATGSGLSYQWQKSTDGGSSWKNDTTDTATAKTPNLTFITTPSDTLPGTQYRCYILGSCGSVASNAGRVGLCFPASISSITGPSDNGVVYGNSATFIATYVQGSNLVYAWQKQAKNDTAWVLVSNAIGQYTYNPPLSDSGAKFKCKVTGACGAAQVSNACTLSVWTQAAISDMTHPIDTIVRGGDTARFSVAAIGTGLTYKWYRQRMVNGTLGTPDSVGGAALYKYKTDTLGTDTNAQFYCTVTGHYGSTNVSSVTSRSAKLTLWYTPTITSITASPNNGLNVPPTTIVTHTVAAHNIGPIVYQWQRSDNGGATWTPISGATSSSYSLTVQYSDNGARFDCIVSSGITGSQSVTSSSITLTVCAVPAIAANPGNLGVAEGTSAMFTVAATGTGLSYQWQRRSPGSGTDSNITNATSDTLKLASTVTKTDSGACFRCVVTGTCGSVTSDSALLAVYGKVHARFTMSDAGSNGPWDTLISNAGPDTVYFNDSSTGNIATKTWNYGDGSPLGSLPYHIYDSVATGMNQYTVTLKDSGIGGVDSMSRPVYIYAKNGNPIRISGQYLDSLNSDTSRLVLTLASYSSLSNTIPAPGVASIRLYYQRKTIPTDTTAPLLKSYTTAQLKAQGTVYKDTLHVPTIPSPDSVYGFMSRIVWNDANTTPFSPANGCPVLMRDTIRAPNNLVISRSVYPTAAPWNIVQFHIDSTSTIDLSLADMVGFWYGIGADSTPNFATSNPHVTWWNAASVAGSVLDPFGGRFSDTITNDLFNTDLQSQGLHCAVRITNKKNKLWRDVQTSIPVGHTRVKNPIILNAQAVTAGSIQLTWVWDTSAVKRDSADRIRISFRPATAVPLNYQMTSGSFDTLIAMPADTLKWVYQYRNGDFSPNTRYYFGAQAHKDSLWSLSRADANDHAQTVTPAKDTIPVANKLIVTSAVFDTATNLMHVSWRVDTTGGFPLGGLNFGVSASLQNGLPKDTNLMKLQSADGIIDSGSITAVTGSATFGLGDAQMFNTTYYVFLWLMKTGGVWSLPVDTSTATCTVPLFTWQAIHFTYNLVPAIDMTFWANSGLRIVVPPISNSMNAYTHTAQINKFTPASSSVAGFIQTGQVFDFTDYSTLTDPIDVGIKCAVPNGHSLHDVRIYQYDSASGTWYLATGTLYDTVNSYVYILTTDLSKPFAAMIDTTKPQVTWIDSSSAPVRPLTAITNSISVKDNTGNLAWSLVYMMGGMPASGPGLSQHGNLIRGDSTLSVHIDAASIVDQNGVRALFIADDGRNKDTLDLSRKVFRDVNQLFPAAMQWTPLNVTCTLDSSVSAKRMFRSVSASYDIYKIRLFRFNPYGTGNAWVEYADNLDTTVFALKPGRLLWVKTKNNATFDVGPGVTLPLQPDAAVTIPLGSGWTDFALPYRFDMRVGDIVAATKKSAGTAADSLDFYEWTKDNATGKYSSCQPLFIPSFAPFNNPASVMYFSHDTNAVVIGGFSVYNRASAMALRIPPVSAALSPITGAGKKTAPAGWVVKVVSHNTDGSLLTPVLCGYDATNAPGSVTFPMPPTLEDVSVGFCNEQTGAVYGNRLLHSLTNNGCSHLLAFKNDAPNAQKVTFSLDRLGAFPAAMKTAVFNPLTGEMLVLSGPDALTVNIDPRSVQYRWLLAGDQNYIATAAKNMTVVRLALDRVFPNPARAVVHLRYTAPANVKQIQFMVLDISGRLVWRKNIDELSPLGGAQECLWYGVTAAGKRVAAGVYIIKMSAFDTKNKLVGSFDRRLTVLP